MTGRARRTLPLLGVLLLALSPACARSPERPPNIVLLLIDTLRADHLPMYGYSRNTAPNLARLARAGVLFERVIAPSSWTKTSMASIMTSRGPDGHGVRGVSDALPGDLPTLAECLQRGGYTTLGVNTNPWLEPRFGFGRGFDRYASGITAPRFTPAREANEAALRLLAERDDEPFFLYVHYMDVHAPYVPPRRYAPEDRFVELDGRKLHDSVVERRYRKRGLDGPAVQRRVIRLYDAEIRTVDAAIGRLLERLRDAGRLENTVVVVTADHGEAFREHGWSGHGRSLYPEVVEVPLLLVWDDHLAEDARVGRQVRSIDIAPTLLGLAGVPRPASFRGTPLLPLASAGSKPLTALAGVGLNDRIPERDYAAVVTPRYLYVRERRSGAAELFDLREDPGAQHDLGPDHPAAARLEARLGERPGRSVPQAPLDDATREQLHALGYLDAD